MTYQVWHADNPTFIDNPPATLAAFPMGFTHVADVETDNVGDVFRLTNHIDQPFWRNPKVTLREVGPRSTSVGDVITERGAASLIAALWGKRWTIQMIGLKEF